MARIIRKTVAGKVCTLCAEWKPLASFGQRSDYPGKHRSCCKQCRNATERESNRLRINRLRRDNPEVFRERDRRYRRANPEKISAAHKIWRLRSGYKQHPDAAAAAKHKMRAKIAGTGGSFTKDQWARLKADFGYRCARCGCDGVTLHVDHVIPIFAGGTSDISNIQPLCQSCNFIKGATAVDYRNRS